MGKAVTDTLLFSAAFDLMGTKKENWKGEKRVNIEYNTEGTVEELSLKFKHSKKLSELNKQFF